MYKYLVIKSLFRLQNGSYNQYNNVWKYFRLYMKTNSYFVHPFNINNIILIIIQHGGS